MKAPTSRSKSRRGTGDGGLSRRDLLIRLGSGAAAAAVSIPALAGAAADDGESPPSACQLDPGLPPGTGDDLTLPASDPLNDIKAMFDVAFSFIPVFGGAISVLFDLLFPQSAVNLWQTLSTQINNLVTERLQQSDLDKMQVWLTGSDASGATQGGIAAAIKNYLYLQQQYQKHPDPQIQSTLIASADSIHQSFTTNVGFFQPAGYEDRSLPLFAQFANLHLLFLRDIVLNGAKIGFDADLVAVYDGYLTGYTDSTGVAQPGYIKAYADYVDASMPTAIARLNKHYADNRDIYQDWEAPNDDTGYIVTGAWQAKREQNDALSLLQYAVADYRTLWPTMLDPDGGHANLTREIWFGPYGKPDMRDIGLDPLYVENDNHGPVAAVPDPVTPPAAPLTFINIPYLGAEHYGDPHWHKPNIFRTGTRYWQFPTDIPGSWGGGSNGDWWGLNLDAKNGGSPVVGIRVDIARYISRAMGPGSDIPCSPGHLVSAMWFTQKNKTVTVSPGHDTVGAEIKEIWSDTVPVPQGHVLASATITSRVSQLYANTFDDGATSIGSIIFGFKLENPTLKLPSPSLLKAYYVGSLESMSLVDLAYLSARWQEAAGQYSADGDIDAIYARLQAYAERMSWDVDRATFLASIARSSR